MQCRFMSISYFYSFFIQEDDKYDLMLFDTINPWMLFLGNASTVISKKFNKTFVSSMLHFKEILLIYQWDNR